MEKLVLTDSINLLCVTATSFPEGITDAFTNLQSLIPNAEDRTFFGISYPLNGKIIYKAAVEQKSEGEAKEFGLEAFTIPSGIYLTETINNFMENIPLIGETFQALLASPQLDQFPCIEWYKSNTDVMCMVKLKE